MLDIVSFICLFQNEPATGLTVCGAEPTHQVGSGHKANQANKDNPNDIKYIANASGLLLATPPVMDATIAGR